MKMNGLHTLVKQLKKLAEDLEEVGEIEEEFEKALRQAERNGLRRAKFDGRSLEMDFGPVQIEWRDNPVHWFQGSTDGTYFVEMRTKIPQGTITTKREKGMSAGFGWPHALTSRLDKTKEEVDRPSGPGILDPADWDPSGLTPSREDKFDVESYAKMLVDAAGGKEKFIDLAMKYAEKDIKDREEWDDDLDSEKKEEIIEEWLRWDTW